MYFSNINILTCFNQKTSLFNNNKIDKELDGRWFSDAFISPIYSLINAIDNNIQPETNIIDAFKTLKLVDLIEKSHEKGKTIPCS